MYQCNFYKDINHSLVCQSQTGASICQGAPGTLMSTINENRLTIPGSWATSPIANRPNTSTNSTTCGFSTTVTRNYTATRFQVSQTDLMSFNG